MKNIDYSDLVSKLDSALVHHTTLENAIKEVRRSVTHSGRYSEAQVFIILGESRSGKTRVLETVEAEFPPEQTKTTCYRPIVRVSVPRGAKSNGILALVLDAMGDKFCSRGSETDKLIRLQKFSEKLRVKVIIIDEFQHLVRPSKFNQFDTADGLKVLADQAKVNLVLAGLSYSIAIINSNPQLSGRARRPITLKRFNWVTPEDRSEFIAIIEGFTSALTPLRFPNFGTEEWGFRWYCATGGLVGYVAKIFKEALDNAEENKTTFVTIEDLDIAHYSTFTKDSEQSATMRPFTVDFNPIPTAESMRMALEIGAIVEPWNDQ